MHGNYSYADKDAASREARRNAYYASIQQGKETFALDTRPLNLFDNIYKPAQLKHKPTAPASTDQASGAATIDTVSLESLGASLAMATTQSSRRFPAERLKAAQEAIATVDLPGLRLALGPEYTDTSKKGIDPLRYKRASQRNQWEWAKAQCKLIAINMIEKALFTFLQDNNLLTGTQLSASVESASSHSRGIFSVFSTQRSQEDNNAPTAKSPFHQFLDKASALTKTTAELAALGIRSESAIAEFQIQLANENAALQTARTPFDLREAFYSFLTHRKNLEATCQQRENIQTNLDNRYNAIDIDKVWETYEEEMLAYQRIATFMRTQNEQDDEDDGKCINIGANNANIDENAIRQEIIAFRNSELASMPIGDQNNPDYNYDVDDQPSLLDLAIIQYNNKSDPGMLPLIEYLACRGATFSIPTTSESNDEQDQASVKLRASVIRHNVLKIHWAILEHVLPFADMPSHHREEQRRNVLDAISDLNYAAKNSRLHDPAIGPLRGAEMGKLLPLYQSNNISEEELAKQIAFIKQNTYNYTLFGIEFPQFQINPSFEILGLKIGINLDTRTLYTKAQAIGAQHNIQPAVLAPTPAASSQAQTGLLGFSSGFNQLIGGTTNNNNTDDFDDDFDVDTTNVRASTRLMALGDGTNKNKNRYGSTPVSINS